MTRLDSKVQSLLSGWGCRHDLLPRESPESSSAQLDDGSTLLLLETDGEHSGMYVQMVVSVRERPGVTLLDEIAREALSIFSDDEDFACTVIRLDVEEGSFWDVNVFYSSISGGCFIQLKGARFSPGIDRIRDIIMLARGGAGETGTTPNGVDLSR